MFFHSNGFIVTKPPVSINNMQYCGVDNDAFPFGIDIISGNELQNLAESCFMDLSNVFLVTLTSAREYLYTCQSKSCPARLLYCETSAQNLSFSQLWHQRYAKKAMFLGFDYAYPSGSFYSTVLNDLIFRKTALSEKWRSSLNSNGLFPTLKSICQFVKDREEIISQDKSPYMFERGKFIIFRLFQIEPEHPS